MYSNVLIFHDTLSNIWLISCLPVVFIGKTKTQELKQFTVPYNSVLISYLSGGRNLLFSTEVVFLNASKTLKAYCSWWCHSCCRMYHWYIKAPSVHQSSPSRMLHIWKKTNWNENNIKELPAAQMTFLCSSLLRHYKRQISFTIISWH